MKTQDFGVLFFFPSFFHFFLFFFGGEGCIFKYSSGTDLFLRDKGCAAANNPLPRRFPQDPAEEGWRDHPSVHPSTHPLPRTFPLPLQPYRARRLPRWERRTGAEPARPRRAPAVMSASLLPLPGYRRGGEL